jgi:hypothetical protein
MTSHCYKITDPDVVVAYVEARGLYAQWRRDGAAFIDGLGPAVYGATGRSFTGEQSGIALRLERGYEAGDLPEGWRYVKTRGSVEPKLHAAGEAAREAFAPFKDTPRQPATVLKEHKVPTFLFDENHHAAHTAGHFEHAGVIYLTYGIPVDDRNDSPLLVPIKESEYVLAREAQDEAGR